MNARFNAAWQFLKQDVEDEDEDAGLPVPIPTPSADRDAPAVTNIEQQAVDPAAWRDDLHENWETRLVRMMGGLSLIHI